MRSNVPTSEDGTPVEYRKRTKLLVTRPPPRAVRERSGQSRSGKAELSIKSNVSGSMSGTVSEDPSEASQVLLEPAGPPAFVDGSLKMFKANKIYALLVFVPLAIMAEFAEAPEYAIFFLACLAILPLAGLLGDATEQVALHTNDTLGGLLNATFGNATEMIVCFFAL